MTEPKPPTRSAIFGDSATHSFDPPRTVVVTAEELEQPHARITITLLSVFRKLPA
jgi:hypothetical protein